MPNAAPLRAQNDLASGLGVRLGDLTARLHPDHRARLAAALSKASMMTEMVVVRKAHAMTVRKEFFNQVRKAGSEVTKMGTLSAGPLDKECWHDASARRLTEMPNATWCVVLFAAPAHPPTKLAPPTDSKRLPSRLPVVHGGAGGASNEENEPAPVASPPSRLAGESCFPT